MDRAFSGDFFRNLNRNKVKIESAGFDTEDSKDLTEKTVRLPEKAPFFFPNAQILNRNLKWKFERKVTLRKCFI